MKLERWQQIDKLLESALERDPSQWAAFLDQECAGDEELRKKLEALLAARQKAESFLVSPALEVVAQAVAEQQARSLVGRRLGPYQVLSLLGAGGMGEVYRTHDSRLDRDVAIKVLPEHLAQNPDALSRFKREAKAVAALSHPNILAIYDFGTDEGVCYAVMELLEGETLRACMARSALGWHKALEIGLAIAEGLSAAHSKGIIHRDLKPENIFLTTDGQVKILDFGLARVKSVVSSQEQSSTPTVSHVTEPGMVMGTAGYMSPEQVRGEVADVPSDIFTFGCILYEMVSGQRAFASRTAADTMAAILKDDPPGLADLGKEIPRELERVIRHCLEKNPAQRYQSARDLVFELRATLEVSPSGKQVEQLSIAAISETFVGREPEMKRLEELLQQAIQGSGTVVFITGEAGIGKTALADEFMQRARRKHPTFIFSSGRCVEQYGTGEAYLSLLDAIGAILVGSGRERVTGVLRTYAPTWCLQFPATFASAGTMERLQRETIGATRERMLREMGDALEALAANSPVVLLLEDLHWADPSSIDLLRHLSQRISRQRLLVVGTFRPENLELSNPPLKKYKLETQAHDQYQEIALPLLNQEHIAGYLNTRFAPNDFPRELSSLIQSKTEGHPLFATCLVEFLTERGDIVRVNEHWTLTRPLSEMDLEAPESVRSMIRRKIESLGDEDRRALQYASVEGGEFISTVLANLLGGDDLDLEERLDRLGKVHHLIETHGEEELPDGALAMRYRFTHVLYQNVLYEELVSKRRIWLHRRVGEQLMKHYGEEAQRIATQLAMHFERGRDFTLAVEYFIKAGDNATHRYANAEAEQHYSHALRLVEKLPPDDQAGRYLTIYQKRGMVNTAMSRFDQAVDDFTQLVNRSRAIGDAALESAALTGLAHALFFSHRFDEMAACIEESMSAAERARNDGLRIEAMMLIALKQASNGELAELKPLLDEIIRTARSIHHKPGLCTGLVYRGKVHFFQSEYERAEQVLEEALNLASELRDGFLLLICLFGLGLTRGNLGRMSEALATLNEAMEAARRNGDHFWLPRLPNCIGWIYRELQDFEQALKHDQQGVEIAREDHVTEAEANSFINLGYDYMHIGKGEETLSAFREVEACFERDAWFRWRYNIRLQAGASEYWLSKGDLSRAEVHARRLLETATHHEARKYIAVAHKLFAEIAIARGDLAEGEAELSAALDQLREYPVPIIAWKIYTSLGRLRLHLGEKQAAHEAFAQAAKIINTIAAGVSDERLRETFLNSAIVREVLEGSGESF